jgi:perosamine synthetase
VAERNPHPKYGPPKVITDAARACGGEYKGTKIGKKGWQTVFSFHTMKLMTTLGEGGMITTDDPDLHERLKAIRMWGSGTDGWGANYKMTKVQAAVGLVQLDRLEEMNAARYRLGQQRNELLEGTPGLTLPYEPPDSKHTYYLYTCLVPDEWAGQKRDRVMQILQDDYGVGAVVANAPTYNGRGYVNKNTTERFPDMEHLAARLFCISLHALMSEEDNRYVAAATIDAMERVRKEA